MTWKTMKTAPTVTGAEILALIQGCDTGTLRRVVLERVNESDCEWRFDGEEISYAWNIIGWTELPALPSILRTSTGKALIFNPDENVAVMDKELFDDLRDAPCRHYARYKAKFMPTCGCRPCNDKWKQAQETK